MADVRGNPWEHDPGPTGASGWAELFAETPNYRGLGLAVVGREAFRWHHGPMFFRGRLDGSAKVVIVGQEGAQDESLSHRSFTGGTGARMQHFLRFLGLDRSYLFLNSFVYPIFGQYTDDLRPLAQDPAVAGRQAPESDPRQGGRRWRRPPRRRGRSGRQGVRRDVDRGPRRQRRSRTRCTTRSLGSIPNRVKVVGVLHPGGAAGGSTAAHQGRLRARHRPRPGLAPGRSGLAPGRSGHVAEPQRDVPVLLGRHPVPRLPVRDVPAPRPRRHVEQPQ